MFNNIYKGKRVFITGNTGFKGSWLSLWLINQGANVFGYSLEIPTNPSHHDILNLDIETVFGDIRDFQKLNQSLKSFRPDIVFHLAAQPIVRISYKNPVETFETNIIGTVNLLEASRKLDSVRVIVNITSDKCYENKEWIWGYRENDALGGHDPYSTSKGCAELVTTSYRRSFFPTDDYMKKHHTLISSVRAGNIIGGGDWGEDRLVPDIMRATSKNEKTIIRNPQSTRPWQHVLEPLSGYLLLGQRLLEGKKEFSGAWNFGPNEEGHKNVLTVVKELKNHWDKIDFQMNKTGDESHEAILLKLDCSKAHVKLDWKAIWDSSVTIASTAQWYREFYEANRVLSQEQLDDYIESARQKHMPFVI